MDPLTSAGLALFVCGWAGLLARRLRRHHANGLFAIAEGLFCIDDIRLNDPLGTVFCAACCALYAYWWWHGGGGNGTKRRLRALRRKFQATRRTAPQPT